MICQFDYNQADYWTITWEFDSEFFWGIVFKYEERIGKWMDYKYLTYNMNFWVYNWVI